jgi:imidazole glycerol-phosphate synthase subunit HisH
MTIAIVNYGMCNIHTVYRKLVECGVNPVVTSLATDLYKADKIILPGIGNFAKAMQYLNEHQLTPALCEQVMVKKKPILGICLGMQLMTKKSEEGNCDGLGWIDAAVEKFKPADSENKIPQIGWNTVTKKNDTALLTGVPDEAMFYFTHSYRLINTAQDIIAGQTVYGETYTSAISTNNIAGVQFHPEKSYETGQQIFKNFIRLY